MQACGDSPGGGCAAALEHDAEGRPCESSSEIGGAQHSAHFAGNCPEHSLAVGAFSTGQPVDFDDDERERGVWRERCDWAIAWPGRSCGGRGPGTGSAAPGPDVRPPEEA